VSLSLPYSNAPMSPTTIGRPPSDDAGENFQLKSMPPEGSAALLCIRLECFGRNFSRKEDPSCARKTVLKTPHLCGNEGNPTFHVV
jgi:hypothetical protein